MSDDLKKKILAGLSDLYSRTEIVADRSLVPPKGGFNFWFFKEIPSGTPTDGCFRKDGLPLLYAGISPDRAKSKANLKKRIINNHCKGTAKTSTLRKSLGVLLTEASGYPLRKVGNIMTFTRAGEDWLNDWMDKNAFVCWYEYLNPWEIKREVITIFSPPLNIQDGTHSFGENLRVKRKKAEQMAQNMPIVHK